MGARGGRADRGVVRPDDALGGESGTAALGARVQQGVQRRGHVVVDVDVDGRHRRVLLELQVVLGARGAHEATRGVAVAARRGLRAALVAGESRGFVLGRGGSGRGDGGGVALAHADGRAAGGARVAPGRPTTAGPPLAQHFVRTCRYRVMVVVIVVVIVVVMVGVVIVVPQRVHLLLVLGQEATALLRARQVQH